MDVTFGKHAGKSVELLMLKEPGYIKWILGQSATGNMALVKSHIQKLIDIFDSKPFIGIFCAGHTCNKPATQFTVYLYNLSPYWWCDSCDPYQSGANAGKLQALIGYLGALNHVEFYFSNKNSVLSDFIKMIAQAKGLPKRVGEKQAQDFFS